MTIEFLRNGNGSSISTYMVLSISSALPTVYFSKSSKEIISDFILEKSPKYLVNFLLGEYLIIDTTDVHISVSVAHTFSPINALINVDFPRLNSPHTKIQAGVLFDDSNATFILSSSFFLFNCIKQGAAISMAVSNL